MGNATSRFVALLAVCLFAGGVIRGDKPARDDERLVKLFGGAEALRVVREATSVEAFRIDSDGRDPTNKKKTVAGYEIISGPVQVDRESARKLAAELTKTETYDWERSKGCKPEPGVAVRFTKDKHVVEIWFCFECLILGVIYDEKFADDEDFEISNDSLAIVKKWFPKDKAIQDIGKSDE
jgi:hypothetical protein